MIRRLSVVALLLSACASNPGVELTVRLQTDMIPGAEFDTVVVTVDDGSEERRMVEAGTFLYTAGSTVANYTNIPSGQRRIRVGLVRRGTEVISQEQLFQVSSGSTVTIVITRNCRNTPCLGANTACVDAQCIDPRCTPETPGFCPADRCASNEECGASPQPCLAPTCLDGACLNIDEGTCGTGRYCDPDDGCRGFEMFDGGGVDSGSDAGTDAPPTLCSPDCMGFQICDGGTCVESTGCLTVDECADGLICRNRRCIPPDRDVDGDGSPASEDCDETRPDAYPEAMEACNGLDENCNEMIDEGNPGVLCAAEGGECMGGSCGCPPGQLDIDGIPDTGCECTITPAAGTAMSCAAPTALGTVSDIGQTITVSANSLPAGRDLWYSVIGEDSPDAAVRPATACDNYHFRIRFTQNPGDAYRFEVNRGACSTVSCPGSITEYSFATDFRNAAGEGECPCANNPGAPGANYCTNNGATYFIRVFRRAGAAISCEPFSLEITNGVFDT